MKFIFIILIQILTLAANAQTLKTETVQIELSYGVIAQELYSRRQSMLQSTFRQDYQHCANAGTSQDPRTGAKQFFCDEYPLGETNYGAARTATWSTWKKLITVPVSYKDEKQTRTLNVDVLMSRPQHTARVSKTLLEYGKAVTLQTTPSWIGNWTVQLIPQDNNLYASVCTLMPGFNIDSPTVNGTYTIFQKWFITLNVDYRLYPGNVKFSAVDVCGLMKVYLAKDLMPKYELVAIEQPRLINASLGKPRLEIRSGWARFLLSIYTLFTRKTVDSMVASYLKDYIPTNAELENGEWMKYLPQGLLKERFVSNFRGMVTELSTKNSNDQAQTFDVTKILTDQCARITNQMPKGDLRDTVHQACVTAIASAQLKGQPFVTHGPSKDSKCYALPFLLDNAQKTQIDKMWWSMYYGQSWANKAETDYGCRLIGARITGQYRPEMASLVKCAAYEANLALNKRPQVFSPNACHQEVRALALALLEDYLKNKYAVDSATLASLKALINQTLQGFDRTKAIIFAENFLGNYKDARSVNSAIGTLQSAIASSEFTQIKTSLEQKSAPTLNAHPELRNLVNKHPEIFTTIALVQVLAIKGVGL